MSKEELDKHLYELEMKLAYCRRPNNLEDMAKAEYKLRDLKIRLDILNTYKITSPEIKEK